ncbi:uncharacterized protein LOC62_03G003821 [Vanrija pseudolonga]|uniref:Uncharacterized protein n=1 Tax=Vanrija pseudolonga TaxID=143232 RepID=A0AAF0Y577_9TREE|nr:hypothetical protein LOC62_03G003821 [Vanrija pseudolonga]
MDSNSPQPEIAPPQEDTTSPQGETTSPQEEATSTQEDTASPPAKWQAHPYAIHWALLNHIFDPLLEARPEVFLRTGAEVHARATALLFKHVTVGTVDRYIAEPGTPSEHLFHFCNPTTGARLPFPSFKVVHAYENITGIQAPRIIWQATSTGYRMPAKQRKEILKLIHVIDSPITIPESLFKDLPNLEYWRVYQCEEEYLPSGDAACYYMPAVSKLVLFGPERFDMSWSRPREKIVLHLQSTGTFEQAPSDRAGSCGNPRHFVIIAHPGGHLEEELPQIAVRMHKLGNILAAYARRTGRLPYSSSTLVFLGSSPSCAMFANRRLHSSRWRSMYKATLSEEEAEVELNVSDRILSRFIEYSHIVAEKTLVPPIQILV